MRQTADSLRLSATDLANHLACHHLSQLDLAVARGQRRPPDFFSPDAAVLRERGNEHEMAFLSHLEAQGLRIARPGDGPDENVGFERTLSAMREGADVIVQATLLDGRWFGRADVLRRVSRPSRHLGGWSYEVWDTKLARETKAGSVLQICLYSDLLGTIQGERPELMYIVPPRDDFKPDEYRVDDFMAYYRLVRRRLEAAIGAAPAAGAGVSPRLREGQALLPLFAEPSAAPTSLETTYPDPVPHCDVCRWWPVCDAKRHKDDHLSLVAGISRLQTRELQARGVQTLEALASEPVPLAWKPARGAVESFARAREQARVQRDGRNAGRDLYELLPLQPGRGFERLPAPSPGDVFFDLEGDPFVGPSGREYLFGWVVEDRAGSPEYRCLWALDPAAERQAFEAFVDLVMERWARHPDMHIFHFAPYEPAAMKRLMGRYATRENEVDRMLRAELFVDLHAVVKQSMRVSVEEYSIKKLEALYDYEREADLEDAGVNLRIVQRALELEEPDAVDADVRRVVATYNRDDCVSALRLARWLEGVRAGVEAKGTEIPRPPIGEGLPSEKIAGQDREVHDVMDMLLDGVPVDRTERSEEQQARWLMAYLLEWHRREGKAAWWEFYRLRELSDEDLLDEKRAIAGLQYVGRVVDGVAADRYRFPLQETSIREGSHLKLPLPLDQDFGDVVAIDVAARTLDVKKRGGCAHIHPTSVFAHDYVRTPEQAASLLRLGRWIAEHGVDAPGPHRAARDLLLGRPPRIPRPAGTSLRRADESGLAAARRLVAALGHGTLAIQGPPGTGKTHTGSRMISDLVKAGKRVGVCATSHKVIRNLLNKVVEAAKEEGGSPRCYHKDSDDAEESATGDITVVTDNTRALRALKSGAARVLGGTAWLWSREEFFEAVDVLFVDEAGQMSLANVLAIAQCAGAVVLLGDPRQLDQPLQGSHPEGTEASALEHLLQGRKTIAEDRGLFLEETWRLHPSICALTSELFYDRRLKSVPGLERQAILGPAPIAGAALWFLPVLHDGNQSSSPEEVLAIGALVERLSAGDVRWRKRDGTEHPLRLEDILIIAPYNAQVADLSARLPRDARVGTVDRFQGQEAPVVIYSMTTSTPADAPRGMEFLYSLNRFNVATSRARCACVVVGSPLLFEPECKTPREMRLANACCRYLELAQELPIEALRGST
jgi:predicted RecB family nuclease